MKVMPAHCDPAPTCRIPCAGVTLKSVQPLGTFSVTVWLPGETFEKCAWPSLVFWVVCWPLSKLNMNWGTVVRG